MPTTQPTRQAQAYALLRADILGGRLVPGEKLPFSELCAQYGVSVGVIREALHRLSEMGLVRNEPQRGFMVTPLSRADLVHLTVARREIETLTLRHAINEGGHGWESGVVAAHHRLTLTSMRDPEDAARVSDEWTEVHNAFHDALLVGCANPHLIRIARDLRASAELYRRWSVPLASGSSRDIPGEHRAIVDAVVAHDGPLAIALLGTHIDRTTELLLASGAIVD